MQFCNAKWIWVDNNFSPDSYGEFYSEFNWNGGDVNCLLSCDSDYTLFINGKYAYSNQYGDFEWYKSVDSLNIAPFLKKGKNSIAIVVWYFGINTQRYLKANPGLIFEIFEDNESLVASCEKTLSRYSTTYKNGAQKIITCQLGFSFCFNATKEDGWHVSGNGFTPSVLVDKNCNFVLRPIDKLTLLEKVLSNIIQSDKNHYLIDLGEERVGLPCLEFNSNSEQIITVAWGESLDFGQVRKIIGERDFSFTYIAKRGENKYINYMLRLGCRYIEVWCEESINIEYIGIIPQVFPVKEIEFKLDNELDQGIYNACVKTLKNCMMEHYVDTPWREQCLYAYDSRNQILCGYYAFKNGNKEYVKSNLKLIGQDRRADKLLSICSPCGTDLTIPSFSLYYIIAMAEYLKFTNDKGLLIDLYPRLLEIIDVFVAKINGGLVHKFDKVCHWNFYDWTEYLSSEPYAREEAIPDAMINLLFIIALKNLKEIATSINQPFNFDDVITETSFKTKNSFFCKDKGLFEFTMGGGEFTVLVNALAIIAGLTTKDESTLICSEIASGNLLDCTLSMKIFKYEAMLLCDKERWGEWIISEIRKEYSQMIDGDSLCVWETSDGSKAFENAGSLCHGWSAVPIYFYNKITK